MVLSDQASGQQVAGSDCNMNCMHAHMSVCLVQLVVLSDRISEEEMDIKQPPIPTLLAVGAVHHHLIRSAHALKSDKNKRRLCMACVAKHT